MLQAAPARRDGARSCQGRPAARRRSATGKRAAADQMASRHSPFPSTLLPPRMAHWPLRRIPAPAAAARKKSGNVSRGAAYRDEKPVAGQAEAAASRAVAGGMLGNG